MSGRLFDIDEVPEVPLFREPPPGRGALVMDERIAHDYPPEWHSCQACGGGGLPLESLTIEVRAIADGRRQVWLAATGRTETAVEARVSVVVTEPEGKPLSGLRLRAMAVEQLRWKLHALQPELLCRDCLGMGSVKARARLEAGHRCVRCGHPYMPKGDAKMLGVEPTPHHWSPCDERCEHVGAIRTREADEEWVEWQVASSGVEFKRIGDLIRGGLTVEAEWRILTVHHLDGDKANVRWWNLASLCQRCHLEIQGRVVMDRVYPHEHSEWFRPYAAGYYAFVYLGEELSRPEAEARMGELLALERIA